MHYLLHMIADHFVPLMSSMVFSSLWIREPSHVKIVFVTMLVLKNQEHLVSQSAFAIGSMCGLTEEEVLDALRVLSEPDLHRKEPQPHEGRRIQKMPDGSWFILNGQKYQDEMSAIIARAKNRQRMREQREAERNAPKPARRGSRSGDIRHTAEERQYTEIAKEYGQEIADAWAARKAQGDRPDFATWLKEQQPPDPEDDVPFTESQPGLKPFTPPHSSPLE